jgi:ribose transport system substrate-binding protein
VLSALVLVGCGSSSASHPKVARRYTVYLAGQNYGNGWMPQMLETSQLLIKQELGSQVNLNVEIAANTVSAQIQSLNDIIRARPDILAVVPASPTALNTTLKRACDAGIFVIAVSGEVTEPCVWNVQTDWSAAGAATATWLAQTLHGTGNIFMDLGYPGISTSTDMVNAFTSVLRKYPGIKVACKFSGQYVLAEEQAGAASCLAAHPDVQGLLVQGYGVGALKALTNAGHKPVPFTGGAYNVSALTCMQTHAPCWLMTNPTWIGYLAVQTAVHALNAKLTKPEHLLLNGGSLTNTSASVPGDSAPRAQIVVGSTAFPKLSGNLFLPLSPPNVTLSSGDLAKITG